MEVSFSKEIEALRLGAGQTFHGEGILAITKGLLQSGVSYVGGWQLLWLGNESRRTTWQGR